VRQEGYILLMLKHLSARGSLFLFVRTHHHLQYYFNLSDTRGAANQTRVLTPVDPRRLVNVVEIHPIARPALSQQQ
jgi:hypothetical protein